MITMDSNSSDNVAHKTNFPKNRKIEFSNSSSHQVATSNNSSTSSSGRRTDFYDSHKPRDGKRDERGSSKDYIRNKSRDSDRDRDRDRDRDHDRDRGDRERDRDRNERNRVRSGRDRSDRDRERDRDKFRRDRRDDHDRDRDSKNHSNDRNKRDRKYDSRDRGDRRPSSNERRTQSHSKDYKERKRSRSRSRSRDRAYKSNQPLTRMERDVNKMEQLKKMGIEFGASSLTAAGSTLSTNMNLGSSGNIADNSSSNSSNSDNNATGTGGGSTTTGPNNTSTNKYFPAPTGAIEHKTSAAANTTTSNTMPNKPPSSMDLSNFTAPILISPRYTEQMQKRKLLWSSKKTVAAGADPTKAAAPTTTTNKWEMTKFSQDTDGKVASKFLRLMGMKDAPKPAPDTDNNAGPDVIKKQNEMFTSMEHQYEVARQVTHTMRGMGLGFGSQRQF